MHIKILHLYIGWYMFIRLHRCDVPTPAREAVTMRTPSINPKPETLNPLNPAKPQTQLF